MKTNTKPLPEWVKKEYRVEEVLVAGMTRLYVRKMEKGSIMYSRTMDSDDDTLIITATALEEFSEAGYTLVGICHDTARKEAYALFNNPEVSR